MNSGPRGGGERMEKLSPSSHGSALLCSALLHCLYITFASLSCGNRTPGSDWQGQRSKSNAWHSTEEKTRFLTLHFITLLSFCFLSLFSLLFTYLPPYLVSFCFFPIFHFSFLFVCLSFLLSFMVCHFSAPHSSCACVCLFVCACLCVCQGRICGSCSCVYFLCNFV